MQGIDYEAILARVQKPSRYIGCEINSVHKDLSQVDLRIGLAFPDLYDLGLANLGILLLYSLLNRQPGVWAERVYAPAVDLEEVLRARGLPLVTLESKTPLHQLDCVGFTLQHELNYTNILNMLDLGGIPVFAHQRNSSQPLIIAGGPCAFNPEPLADFIDAFVVGDGEEVTLEIVRELRAIRGLSRDEKLRRFADIEGVYVPSLCTPVRQPDGMLVLPSETPRIRKRVVADLNAAHFPIDYIVPFTEQAHDRISLEVLRGCTHGCRFCHAGFTTRPVRERDLKVLRHLQYETLRHTGYEQVALASLSTSDYTRIWDLADQSVRVAREWGSAVSLPSQRLDSFSMDLSALLQPTHKTGATFAPEAATDRLRTLINKPLTQERLLTTTREAFARGWDTVKLYFMIGLPTETDEDVLAIAHLAHAVLRAGKQVNPRARLHLGVSTFVPKPHTPFQWEQQIGISETQAKQTILGRHLRTPGLKFGRHDARMSFLEGVISRGDRRIGGLLFHAYRLGCRFDGWGDHLRWEKWEAAFERWEVDPEQYLRKRRMEEPLPWDHIDSFVSKQWLMEERQRAHRAVSIGDCRQHGCRQCGVMDKARSLCLDMLQRSQQVSLQRTSTKLIASKNMPDQHEVQHIWFRFSRHGWARFLSHIETVNMFQRALRRARIPVFLTEGFYPRPKLSFATPLPTGMESDDEWAEISLKERMAPDRFAADVNTVLPSGFAILKARDALLRGPSLMSLVAGAVFEVDVPHALMSASTDTDDAIAGFLAKQECIVTRRKQNGATQTVNIRSLVADISTIPSGSADSVRLRVTLRNVEGRQGKPGEVVQALFGIGEDQLTEIKMRKTLTLLKQ